MGFKHDTYKSIVDIFDTSWYMLVDEFGDSNLSDMGHDMTIQERRIRINQPVQWSFYHVFVSFMALYGQRGRSTTKQSWMPRILIGQSGISRDEDWTANWQSREIEHFTKQNIWMSWTATDSGSPVTFTIQWDGDFNNSMMGVPHIGGSLICLISPSVPCVGINRPPQELLVMIRL